MSRQLVVRASARSDLRQNVNWLRAILSQRRADRWYDAIAHSIREVAINPDRYPEADEAAELSINLRFKMHGRRPHIFRILFVYDDTTVTVIRVLHAAQGRLTGDDL